VADVTPAWNKKNLFTGNKTENIMENKYFHNMTRKNIRFRIGFMARAFDKF